MNPAEPDRLRTPAFLRRFAFGPEHGIPAPLVILAAWVGLVLFAMSIDVVSIGGVEEFELTKAALWCRGFDLYSEVWNDQPPIHTVILGACFRLFGPTIAVGRAVAATFSGLLVLALWRLVNRDCGRAAAFLAVGGLVCAPAVPELLFAVMLEVPALGTALWALWLARPSPANAGLRLAASAALAAAALQIKLTSLVIFPAIAVELCFEGFHREPRPRSIGPILRRLIHWIAVFLAALALSHLAFGSVPNEVLLGSHFSPETRANAGETPQSTFALQFFYGHPEALSGVIAAVLASATTRAWSRLRTPAAILAAASLIHTFHRPWWPYYYLHFAIPLAWITSIGLASGIDAVRRLWSCPARFPPLAPVAQAVLALASACALGVFGGSRLREQTDAISRSPRITGNPLIQSMKARATQTRFVYTRHTIFPFHAGLCVIPDLAVIPRKRLWSGQLSEPDIWRRIEAVRPEQILLMGDTGSSDSCRLLETAYVPIQRAQGYVLFALRPTMANASSDPSSDLPRR